MSTAYSSAKQQYIGNGVTTEWGFDFPIKKHSELKVYLKRSTSPQVLLEEGVDYSFVTENTITFPIKTGEAKLQAADVLALQRESVFESEYNFSNQQRLEPEEVMHADDNLERQIQELKRDVSQAIRIQPTSNIDTDTFFEQVDRVYGSVDNIDTVANDKANLDTVAGSITNVNTVAGDIESVKTVANNIESVVVDATNISHIKTVAGSIANVNKTAGSIDNVNVVAPYISSVNTVSANISSVNTAASNMAAIKAAPTAAANAAQSAANAANSATASANSATASAASAQQAAISAAGTHFKLFHHQWFDYELNDMAWLRADTFSWQSGTVYANAYNHLVDDINGITPATETVGGQTVTFYRASDGHKVVLADQETTVNNIYTATGVAWYYILDTVNNRFKLPRTKYDFNGLRGNVGDYITESLPNITGAINGVCGQNAIGDTCGTGVFANAVVHENSNVRGTSAGSLANFPFSASKSSSTYQDNAPVQQRGTQQYLYFYVGQYTQSAIEQTAGLNAELFNNKIDIDGNNVITAGANKILNTSSYTTNRILEIPQDIKLELNNGKLTLKAGSKVYVPNGPGVFNEITTTKDCSVSSPIGANNTKVFLAYRNNVITTRSVSSSVSGAGVTTSSGFAFDTTANKINFYNSSGVLQSESWSFPVAIVSTDSSGVASSIDQVFNGFGYIGSTVFALPGVKGLIPNGRNADGSFKNIEARTDSVITYTNINKGNRWYSFKSPVNGIWTEINYKTDNSLSVGTQSKSWFFDENTNYWMFDGNKSYNWIDFAHSNIGTDSPFAITSFTPRNVDSIANSNASNFSQAGRSYLSGLGMPSSRYIDLTLGASGSTYTAPANGWFSWYCYQNNNGYIFVQTSVSLLPNRVANSSNDIAGFIPVKKGDTVRVEYANLTFKRLRFIYAEGENNV